MTDNGNKTDYQPITLERNDADTFLLTYGSGTVTTLVYTDEGTPEEAFAGVRDFLGREYEWVQHVTRNDLWIAVGVKE